MTLRALFGTMPIPLTCSVLLTLSIKLCLNFDLQFEHIHVMNYTHNTKYYRRPIDYIAHLRETSENDFNMYCQLFIIFLK